MLIFLVFDRVRSRVDDDDRTRSARRLPGGVGRDGDGVSRDERLGSTERVAVEPAVIRAGGNPRVKRARDRSSTDRDGEAIVHPGRARRRVPRGLGVPPQDRVAAGTTQRRPTPAALGVGVVRAVLSRGHRMELSALPNVREGRGNFAARDGSGATRAVREGNTPRGRIRGRGVMRRHRYRTSYI